MSTVGQEARTGVDPPPASLWQNHDFLKFWIGETLSMLGSQVTNLALPLTAIYAFNATDDEVGILRFVQLAPYIGLALLFGTWADRYRRRPVMLWTNVVRMVLIALAPVLHWFGVLNMPLLLAIACVVGIASVLFDVTWMPFVPAVVKDSEHFVEANAKMGFSYSASLVAGPGLAGLLIAVLTAPVTLVVDSVSYLASVISLLLIRTPEPRPPRPAERHLGNELRVGLNWVFGTPILRWLAIAGFCCNFSTTAVSTMFLLYATRQLHLTSSTIGSIFTISAVGGVIGAMIAGRLLKRFPLGPVYFLSLAVPFLSPVVIVVAAGPRLVVVGLVIVSFFCSYLALGVSNVVVISVRQAITVPSLMGRMTACFRMLLFGGGALGGLAAGLLAGGLGEKNGLIAGAAGSAAAVILLVLSPVSRLREVPPVAKEPSG